jgi:NAD(P)H-hydrate repair Nnr-like enzyme with NAD(P)H-hydrate dehydratase domain
VVAPPDGLHLVFANTTGTPWLATAGSGDVLSGLAGALLAQGLLPPQAGIAAAYLHGLAGRFAAAGPEGEGPEGGGEAPIGASDLVRAVQAAFRAVAAEGL